MYSSPSSRSRCKTASAIAAQLRVFPLLSSLGPWRVQLAARACAGRARTHNSWQEGRSLPGLCSARPVAVPGWCQIGRGARSFQPDPCKSGTDSLGSCGSSAPSCTGASAGQGKPFCDKACGPFPNSSPAGPRIFERATYPRVGMVVAVERLRGTAACGRGGAPGGPPSKRQGTGSTTCTAVSSCRGSPSSPSSSSLFDRQHWV